MSRPVEDLHAIPARRLPILPRRVVGIVVGETALVSLVVVVLHAVGLV